MTEFEPEDEAETPISFATLLSRHCKVPSVRATTTSSCGKDETGGHVAAPIFSDFMIAALKDTPAVDFRIPPGLRLYRVSAATGLPVSGNQRAIYEAYKPGTEPGKHQNLGRRNVPGGGEKSVASTRQEDQAPTPMTLPSHAVPASGTGGLY